MANKTKGSPSLTTQSRKVIIYRPSSSTSPSPKYSESQWQNTIKNIAPAVLAMEMTFAMDFEGIPSFQSFGTAFIVDKKHGIAATNYHTVTNGPATFSLRFVSGERVPACRMYTNPSHDFAFMKFDPSLIECTDLVEIQLHPDGAQHGVEITVPGNDSGEKFLTCRGIINKLEFMTVEDQDISNSFFTKANIVTQGGSSGSPVVDINGKAVGISANSGIGDAGLVPLDKVVGAFEILKNGFDNSGNWRPIKIPRKTLGASFVLRTLGNLKDRGVITEEDGLSIAKEYGDTLFGVEHLRMKSELEKNDLLLEINGLKLADLVEVETIVDAMEEEFVTLKVARKNDPKRCLEKLILKVKLFDMEVDKTCEILQMSGSSIYIASHTSASTRKIDVGSLLVDRRGACFEMFMNEKSVLTSINGKKITCFNDFFKELEKSVFDNNALELNIQSASKNATTTRVYLEFYKWCSFAFIWRLPKDTLEWTRETHEFERLPRIDFGISPLLGGKHQLRDSPFSLTSRYPSNHKPIETCLVGVSYAIPDYIDNISNIRSCYHRYGTGIVIYQNSEIGIVLVTQPNVPLIVGRVTLYFNPNLSVVSAVFFVDTNRGFSLIYYNPRHMGNYSDKIQPVQLSPSSLAFNDKVRLLCQDRKRQEPVYLRCRFKLDDRGSDPDIPCGDKFGLIVDNDLRVKALSLKISDNYEIVKIFSISPILKSLDMVMNWMLRDPRSLCCKVKLPVFQAKLISIPVDDAIKLGLSYQWVNTILHKPMCKRRFLMVKYCLAESKLAQSLKCGDLILAINREHVCSMEDLDLHLFGERNLIIRILRHGMEQNFWAEREFISKPPKTCIALWCGLLVQDTPRDLEFNKGFTPRRGVLVNRRLSSNRGCPSELVDGCCWITELNGTKVGNLDQFFRVTAMFSDGEDVLCKLIAWNGKTIAFNYTLDFLHFPTIALTFDEVKQLWTQHEVSPKPRRLTS